MVKPGDLIRFNIPTEEADWEGCPNQPGQHRLFWGRKNPIPGHEKSLAADFRSDPSSGVYAVVEVISGYTNLQSKKIDTFVAVYGYEGAYVSASAFDVVGHDSNFSTPNPTGQSIYESRKKKGCCKWGCLPGTCR